MRFLQSMYRFFHSRVRTTVAFMGFLFVLFFCSVLFALLHIWQGLSLSRLKQALRSACQQLACASRFLYVCECVWCESVDVDVYMCVLYAVNEF